MRRDATRRRNSVGRNGCKNVNKGSLPVEFLEPERERLGQPWAQRLTHPSPWFFSPRRLRSQPGPAGHGHLGVGWPCGQMEQEPGRVEVPPLEKAARGGLLGRPRGFCRSLGHGRSSLLARGPRRPDSGSLWTLTWPRPARGFPPWPLPSNLGDSWKAAEIGLDCLKLVKSAMTPSPSSPGTRFRERIPAGRCGPSRRIQPRRAPSFGQDAGSLLPYLPGPLGAGGQPVCARMGLQPDAAKAGRCPDDAIPGSAAAGGGVAAAALETKSDGCGRIPAAESGAREWHRLAERTAGVFTFWALVTATPPDGDMKLPASHGGASHRRQSRQNGANLGSTLRLSRIGTRMLAAGGTTLEPVDVASPEYPGTGRIPCFSPKRPDHRPGHGVCRRLRRWAEAWSKMVTLYANP